MLPIGNGPGTKYPPPPGWTGHGAPMPSGSDVAAWQETHGDRNIGLRLPPGVIGLDVDQYAKAGIAKSGGDTLAELSLKFGPLPATWITSARTDGVSGIRLYRVPTHDAEGREINWPGEAGPNIEIIQTGHRYALVWPSINPEAGGATYAWRPRPGYSMRRGDIPKPDELPDLPAAWVTGLALPYERTAKSDLADSDLAAWYAALRRREPCPVVRKVYEQAVASVKADAGSRHEAARDAARAIAAFGGEGHSGAPAALEALARHFNDAIGAERAAGGEWDRLLVGAVRLAITKNPSPRQIDTCRPPDVSFAGVVDNPTVPAADTIPIPPAAGSLTLPDEFWQARPSLLQIRQAAHSRVRSADVVFYGTLVRLAALVPHGVRAQTGVGTAASLNLFAAIVGPSGSGKSSGLSVARDVLPAAELEQVPLGSGEGLAEAFMGMVSVDDPSGAMTRDGAAKKVRQKAQVRHNLLAETDEGASLNKLLERTGSTVGEALRSAWGGETIGQRNGREETTRVVHAGSYSLGVLIGYQPATIGPLLADVDAGTPQRFLYGWAIDDSIPGRDARVEWPGATPNPFPPEVPTDAGPAAPAVFSQPGNARHITPITYAQAIKDELYDEQHAKATGLFTPEPFRSQHTLLKIKVSALLALLDHGRRVVTEDDWRLAQIVLDVSDRVRTHLQSQARDAAARDRAAFVAAEHEVEHYREQARRSVAAALEQTAERRVAAKISRWLHADGPMTLGAVRRKLTSADRKLAEAGIELAAEAGWLLLVADKLEPGPSAPV